MIKADKPFIFKGDNGQTIQASKDDVIYVVVSDNQLGDLSCSGRVLTGYVPTEPGQRKIMGTELGWVRTENITNINKANLGLILSNFIKTELDELNPGVTFTIE